MSNAPPKKTVTIFVNTHDEEWPKEKITYEEVVELAKKYLSPPPPPNTKFTVVYSKGHSDNIKGKLTAGQTVKAKEGMQFDVDATVES
jgi:hypothetical protein